MSGSGEDKRYPQNLTGLLRFALEQTKSEDAPNPSAYEQMDEERKIFLEEAFKSMTVDVIKEFEKALRTLEDENSTVEDKEEALNVIRDNVCHIDFANSFIKLGGTTILLSYAKHPSFRLRKIAIMIIAEMAQNNPVSQRHFIQAGVLELLITYFLEQEDIAKNSVYAVSSIIRNYEPALARFIEIGGIPALLTCLKRSEPSIFIKTAFLVAATANEFHMLRDEYVTRGALDILFECIDPVTDFDIRAETVLFAISELTKSPKFKPEPMLKEALITRMNEIITACHALPQCEEMVAYAKLTIENVTNEKPDDRKDLQVATQ